MTDGSLAPGEPRTFGNGRYVVRRRLGAGNFATVYLADDERLAVPVAVKLLSDRWSWDGEVRGRFVSEARLLRSINDSRVVQIRDIDETDDGRPYLVMDVATRGTLDQRLHAMQRAGVHPDIAQLREAARVLSSAIGVLHERRIAHRDIKPSNILITTNEMRPSPPPDGPPRLLHPGERFLLGDLGLAKDLSFDSGITVGVGTAGYMAPEQALAGAKIDTRTDVFALSALFAEIATGEPPDPVRRLSDGQLTGGKPLPVTLPAPLAAVLSRGMDIDASKRQQTVEQWWREVDTALAVALTGPVPVVPSPATAPIASAPVSNPGATAPSPISQPGAHTGPPASAPRAHTGPPASAPPISQPGVHTGPAASGTPRPTRRQLLIGGGAVVGIGVLGGVIAAAMSGGDGIRPPTTDTTATNPLSVTLSGPTRVTQGVATTWDVTTRGNPTEGTWALSGGGVVADPDTWTPGSHFEGTWNQLGPVKLTLTVRDADGNEASDSVTFVVVAG